MIKLDIRKLIYDNVRMIITGNEPRTCNYIKNSCPNVANEKKKKNMSNNIVKGIE